MNIRCRLWKRLLLALAVPAISVLPGLCSPSAHAAPTPTIAIATSNCAFSLTGHNFTPVGAVLLTGFWKSSGVGTPVFIGTKATADGSIIWVVNNLGAGNATLGLVAEDLTTKEHSNRVIVTLSCVK